MDGVIFDDRTERERGRFTGFDLRVELNLTAARRLGAEQTEQYRALLEAELKKPEFRGELARFLGGWIGAAGDRAEVTSTWARIDQATLDRLEDEQRREAQVRIVTSSKSRVLKVEYHPATRRLIFFVKEPKGAKRVPFAGVPEDVWANVDSAAANGSDPAFYMTVLWGRPWGSDGRPLEIVAEPEEELTGEEAAALHEECSVMQHPFFKSLER